MSRLSALKNIAESALLDNVPSAVTPVPRPSQELLSTGIGPVDGLLHGGIPYAAITELVGPACSGRTSITLAHLAIALCRGGVCAWIDASDSLDVESAAANGIDLSRLLWVRCGKDTQLPHSPQAIENSAHVSSLAALSPRHQGSGSSHPRSEGRDMPAAIGALLQAHGGMYDKEMRRERKKIGTPGMPNRPLSLRSEQREEQANSDRQPARRGENLALLKRPVTSPSKCVDFQSFVHSRRAPQLTQWQVLDQAMRATDLLLQGGGFSAIVLDLGNIPPEVAWRIPLATWFRFRAACERTRVSLLLLTQHPCARSGAELVVRLQPGTMDSNGRVMGGVRYQAEIERSRIHKRMPCVIPIRKLPKPVRPGEWRSAAAWS